jgi:hypothetical protein
LAVFGADGIFWGLGLQPHQATFLGFLPGSFKSRVAENPVVLSRGSAPFNFCLRYLFLRFRALYPFPLLFFFILFSALWITRPLSSN